MTQAESIRTAIDAFGAATADPVEAFARLLATLRPRPATDSESAVAAFTVAVEYLEQNPTAAAKLNVALVDLLSSRQLVGYFTDSGILPGTGFFSELWRLISSRVLPEVHDATQLGDCLARVFSQRDDWLWVDGLPQALTLRFWQAVAAHGKVVAAGDRRVLDQLLEAVLLLAYRIAGLGVEREFGRLLPDFIRFKDSFLALADETHRFVDEYRRVLDEKSGVTVDERHLLVMIDQCNAALNRAQRAAQTRGTNLRLTFMLQRGHQSLTRLEALVRMLGASLRPEAQAEGVNGWSMMAYSTIRAENRRRSIRHHFSTLIGLLALRVTDNAAKTGEHYITTTSAEYRSMWRTAGCAGLIIACLALLKIFVGKLDLPLALLGISHSLIYGLGFVLIYMLHWTIATKQPAMTAQTIASYLQEAENGRGTNLERIVDLVAGVTRSQLAAILGNVLIAIPTAIALSYSMTALRGVPLIDADKANHLLHDLHPLSLAIPHAAIAGVFLFLSGLLSGYFDNRATYGRFGDRVAQLGWLQALYGVQRAQAVGAYVERNFGGLMGNFLFGCMLGSAGVIGIIFGLPIDVRHVAFASANLGYALQALDFIVPWSTLALSITGLALVGFTNLTVSFSLALWVALRARRVAFSQTPALIAAVLSRLRTSPRDFFMPPREAIAT